MRSAVGCFVAVGLLAPACAQAAGGNDPWLRMKSANFELFTTAGERAGRDLIRHFEEVRNFFVLGFHLQGDAARPARIIAFRNEKEYAPYRFNGIATAYFQGGRAHDFIVMGSAASDHYPVAVHEYTHLLLRQSDIRFPVWLNEGVADLYSNLEPQGQRVLVGRIIPWRVRSLVSERWIPLRTLLAVEADSPLYNEKARAGMFYAESWLLVHMLQMNPAYSGALAGITEALRTSGPVEAFEKGCRRTAEQVEGDLRAYMNSPTLAARLYDVQMPKSVDAPETEPRAGVVARLALAELLSEGPGLGSRARFAYDALAREFPNRWEVESGLAELLARERQNSEAIAHFARAMKLGANDAQVFVEYGRLLTLANRDRDAVEILKKAVALDPAGSVARFELGAAYVRAGEYAEALREFASISSKLPAEYRPRFVYNLAYAHYRLGQVAEARQIIAEGRKLIRNPAEAAAIERLLRALESTGR